MRADIIRRVRRFTEGRRVPRSISGVARAARRRSDAAPTCRGGHLFDGMRLDRLVGWMRTELPTTVPGCACCRCGGSLRSRSESGYSDAGAPRPRRAQAASPESRARAQAGDVHDAAVARIPMTRHDDQLDQGGKSAPISDQPLNVRWSPRNGQRRARRRDQSSACPSRS